MLQLSTIIYYMIYQRIWVSNTGCLTSERSFYINLYAKGMHENFLQDYPTLTRVVKHFIGHEMWNVSTELGNREMCIFLKLKAMSKKSSQPA